MKLNKKSLILGLAAFLLVGCTNTEIVAKPSDYDSVLVDKTKTEIENNIHSVVIDILRDDSKTKEDVRAAVLNILAEAKFGKWADVDKTSAFAKDVQSRINKKLLTRAKTGNYSYRGKFDEYKFALAFVKELYKVNGTLEIVDDASFKKDVIFTPDITPEKIGLALNVSYYTDYIDRVLVKEIYQEKLVEQYLIDENYRSLYLSHARKVNYIGIKINDNHPEAARHLIDQFIDDNIVGAAATAETANLEILANAWRGIEEGYFANEATLLTSAGLLGTVADLPETPYVDYTFNNTIFGDLVADYAKITDNVKTTDTAIENSFTNNGTYTKEVGLEFKTTNTRMIDYTTDGWYIRDGGLTSLPTAIRDRLFNRQTEEGVDSVLDDNGAVAKAGFIDAAGEKVNNYIRNIDGKYYLMPESVDQNNERNILHFDADSKTYYIIQVEEAVNRAKFDKDTNPVYGTDLDSVVSSVADLLADKETNKTSAMEHFIKQADIKFHDELIYDYFKTTYPEIFK